MVNIEIGCELMKNIKLTVEFDGTNYAGWQRQKNALTIREVLESSITRLTGEKSEVFGSSRTDSEFMQRNMYAISLQKAAYRPKNSRML